MLLMLLEIIFAHIADRAFPAPSKAESKPGCTSSELQFKHLLSSSRQQHLCQEPYPAGALFLAQPPR